MSSKRPTSVVTTRYSAADKTPNPVRSGGRERGNQFRPESGRWGESPPVCGVALMRQREPVSSPRRRPRKEKPLSEIPRDLSSIELWRDSLERSLRRRALAPIARKREARLKRTSVVAGAAVATAPLFPSLGAASAASAPRKSDEPHSRRVENASQQRILLRRGDQTPAVGELQRALEIRVDDVFGRQTEAAVR